MNKTRIDQEAEIRFYFEPYANKGCKECFGTAKKSWISYLGGEKYNAYQICDCVMKNIKKTRKKEIVN